MCDVISVVTEFMIDVVRVEAQSCCGSIAGPVECSLSLTFVAVNSYQTLKVAVQALVRCGVSTEIYTRGCHWLPRLLT
jgi:hypothetical protein